SFGNSSRARIIIEPVRRTKFAACAPIETTAPWAVRRFKSLWETSLKGASTALPLSSNAETPETNAASVVPRELLISRLSLDMGHCPRSLQWTISLRYSGVEPASSHARRTSSIAAHLQENIGNFEASSQSRRHLFHLLK